MERHVKKLSVIRIVLSIVLPPAAVATQVGFKPTFWLNVLLTVLGWLPGIIHALFVVWSAGEENAVVEFGPDAYLDVRRRA